MWEVSDVVVIAESFESFVRDHSTSLLRTGFLLTGDSSAAEELLQDTLAHLYPKWDRVIAAQAPIAYVRRSLTNGFLNARRRRGLQFVDHDPSGDEGTAPDAAELVANRDEASRLLALLNQRQRAAIVMRYFDGLDDADIAETLGCSAATARSLISRGLATMRQAHEASPTSSWRYSS